jgi:hypothetical protein
VTLFAFAYMLRSGEVRALFADEEARRPYLDRFFAERPKSSIAWIHELGSQRYGSAATLLLDQSREAEELVEKHVGDISVVHR